MDENTTNIPLQTRRWNDDLLNHPGKQGRHTAKPTTSNHDSTTQPSFSRTSGLQQNIDKNPEEILVAWNETVDQTIC